MFSLDITGLFLPRYLNKMVAEVFPISNAGCVIVVREGFSKGAVRKFEKVIAFTSCGIFNFNSLHT